LTLRIYASSADNSDPCHGELYLDDGKTYAFQQGKYLRMKFTCQVTADGFHLKVSAHDGSYPAWWNEIRAEVYGWTPKENQASVNGKSVPVTVDPSTKAIVLTMTDTAKGLEAELK
jgi:alpha-glucosidase